jgi:C1A family cysteine protease
MARTKLVKREHSYYGWVPDMPDLRDYLLALPRTTVPARTDLRPLCPPVYDQGELGSCTGNAIAGAMQFERKKQKLADFSPSRLFIYYNERVIEGTVSEDSGAMIRDGIKAVAKLGAPDEKEWPYDISQFAVKPPDAVYADALKDRAVRYARVPRTLLSMKRCLAKGFPFVFGFSVYESFESSAVEKTGKVPMPKTSEQQLGGHAVLAVGYDDKTKRFTVRNSWGSSWGLKGYFTMPYDYLLNPDLADDFWNIQLLTA